MIDTINYTSECFILFWMWYPIYLTKSKLSHTNGNSWRPDHINNFYVLTALTAIDSGSVYIIWKFFIYTMSWSLLLFIFEAQWMFFIKYKCFGRFIDHKLNSVIWAEINMPPKSLLLNASKGWWLPDQSIWTRLYFFYVNARKWVFCCFLLLNFLGRHCQIIPPS